MPVKHAVSHGAATLGGIVVSGLLVRVASESLPSLRQAFDHAAGTVAGPLGWLMGRPVTAEAVSIALLATSLAAVWGLLWSFMHRD